MSNSDTPSVFDSAEADAKRPRFVVMIVDDLSKLDLWSSRLEIERYKLIELSQYVGGPLEPGETALEKFAKSRQRIMQLPSTLTEDTTFYLHVPDYEEKVAQARASGESVFRTIFFPLGISETILFIPNEIYLFIGQGAVALRDHNGDKRERLNSFPDVVNHPASEYFHIFPSRKLQQSGISGMRLPVDGGLPQNPRRVRLPSITGSELQERLKHLLVDPDQVTVGEMEQFEGAVRLELGLAARAMDNLHYHLLPDGVVQIVLTTDNPTTVQAVKTVIDKQTKAGQ